MLTAQGTRYARVPVGTGREPMDVGLVATRSDTGTVGYRRRVSRHTPLRSGLDSRGPARSKVASDAASRVGILERISSRRRVWISGWEARRYITHVKAEDVVSWPAA